jgi:hypothetical protein
MAFARIFKTLLVTALLSACASQEDPYADLPPLDLDAAKQSMNCPSGTTPACEERMGKPVHCFCADRDALQRILEPNK